MLDEYETEGLTPPVGVFSNHNPKISTPPPSSIPSQQTNTPAQTGGLEPI